MATTRFSPPAVKLAAGRGIELIDDAKLALLIRKVFPREYSRETNPLPFSP